MTTLQQRLEEGNSHTKLLSGIDRRLSTVEDTLQLILEKEDELQDSVKEELEKVQEEIQRNTLAMKKMRAKVNSGISSYKIFGLVLVMLCIWTIFANIFRLSV